MSEEETSQRSGFAIFAVGTLIGAGIALLYAPQSGKETRKLLSKKAKQLRDMAQNTVESAQEYIKDRKADFAVDSDNDNEHVEHGRHKRV